MSRRGKPKKSWVSGLNDFCRFCGINTRINGQIEHAQPIFAVNKKGQILHDTLLKSIGVKCDEHDKTKSYRMCSTCIRHMEKVRTCLERVEGWKKAELGEQARTPTSAKRCRESPAKTPRESKKRLLSTPAKATTPATQASASASRSNACGREDAPLPTEESGQNTGPRHRKSLAIIPGRVSDTTVTITYPSGMHNYPCDKSLAGVVENIAKGKLKSSAKLMMSHPILSSEILLQLLSKLRMEVTAMMATANGPSLLRKTSPADLQVFSYDEMEQELKSRAPILHSVLSTVGDESTIHTCVAASIILRGKDARLSAVAYVINSILQHGGVKRSAFDRLCKMGITTSHKHAIKKQKEMSEDHDIPVRLWREAIEQYNHTPIPVSPMEGPSAPIPVAVSPMEGPSAPIPVAVSPMEGPSAPIPVAVSPMEGPSAPIPVAVSPMEGPSAPIPVAVSPMEGPSAPIPVAVSPMEGPSAPIPVAVSQMEGPSAPIPVAVSPMEGPSAPIPVAVSPMEGPSAPIPVAVSPMEGPSAPIPVAVSPMEGPSAPIPVAVSPMEGPSAPIPVAVSTMEGPSAPIPVAV
ncbi:uncharacterized protein, partial [Branchiostoma lanceolatum]|uniref:uncharacterized protein n=1 Tax=Branchiostoma lanceolatum TaxID=7740 RepID=UPI003455CEEF